MYFRDWVFLFLGLVSVSSILFYIFTLIFRDKVLKEYVSKTSLEQYQKDLEKSMQMQSENFEKNLKNVTQGFNNLNMSVLATLQKEYYTKDQVSDKFVSNQMCQKNHETTDIVIKNVEMAIIELKRGFEQFRKEFLDMAQTLLSIAQKNKGV